MCIFMYKQFESTLPKPFKDGFKVTNTVHSYNTRNSSNIYQDKCRTDVHKKALNTLEHICGTRCH